MNPKVIIITTFKIIGNYYIRGKIILIFLFFGIFWDSETEEVLDLEHTTENLPDEVKKEQLKSAEHPDNNNDETSPQDHEESHETNKGTRDFLISKHCSFWYHESYTQNIL